ncbi:MAG TPA: protein translocase SEC61 complex subunit gamma [Thermoplasmatales archaeon]|nr:protein translocase SEC61 complex subunit gamma [Thermoplasmatales archaeon]
MQRKSFLDKAWELQRRIEEKIKHIGKGKYGRILKMARKPTDEEFARTAKITFLGMMVIGAIGFVIYIIRMIVAPWIVSFFGM